MHCICRKSPSSQHEAAYLIQPALRNCRSPARRRHTRELHPKSRQLRLVERTSSQANSISKRFSRLFGEIRVLSSPQHQAALRDVAIVVDEELTNESVLKEIQAAGGDMLAGVRLFDVYRGDSIAAGKKSLAYALTYQADRTLKDTEIDKAHKKVEDRLKHVLKASIRGKE